jgi:twitching motility protein PilT
MAATMHDLLQIMIDRGASDLHITTSTYPQIRVSGKLLQLTEFEQLTPQDTQRLAYSVLNEAQKQKFEEDNELDLSFGIQNLARFRCNVYRERGAVAAAIRVVPFKIRSFDELNLPPIVRQLADRPKGLILVTGPTGSGKSTTLAAMIDKINSERSEHIITIEDPIEFVHPHKKCLVNQREIFADTHSFKNALKSILRQDPDVVLVGEMRDLETIGAALTIAETGHLTLATLHTNSCAQTMNRIIDVFPTEQQSQVRAQLSLVLEGVLSQQLIPKVGGGRVMALEIMVSTPAVRNLIREEKIHQIYSAMQSGQKFGMQTMNQALVELISRRQITREEAMNRSTNPEELAQLLLQVEGAAAGAARRSTSGKEAQAWPSGRTRDERWRAPPRARWRRPTATPPSRSSGARGSSRRPSRRSRPPRSKRGRSAERSRTGRWRSSRASSPR